ncbi:MAG TPA: hypothetical protein VGO46_19195, partial [Gemmatimonadaceae bacterium]|nr:hypothetical protein [Gemmatimonadaceae bacterium]
MLRASLVIWLDVDANAKGRTLTTSMYVPFSDSNAYDEGWTERLSKSADSSRNGALDKLSHQMPAIFAELPLISKCQNESSSSALAAFLPEARALAVRRHGSILAALCIARIFDRAGGSLDSILAITAEILSRDPHNRTALWISAATLDRAMLMDSANVYWHKLGEAGHVIIDRRAGIIHFSLVESPGRNGGDPSTHLSYETTHKYSCLLPLTAEYRVHSDTMQLGPFRLPDGPVDCPAAVGPAAGDRSVALALGRHILSVNHAGSTDVYSIVVTDTTIAIVPTRAPAVSVTFDTLRMRVRRNSFALACGAFEDAPWLCADAVRAIRSTKGIHQLPVLPLMQYPFSGSSGYWHNEPPFFFRYSDFADYQRALSSAFTVYEKVIGRQQGSGLTFSEWRGRDVGTWSWQMLPLTRDVPAPETDLRARVPSAPQPTRLASQFRAMQIGAGADVTCVLTNSASVLCWGRNDAGQLGAGSADTMAHPVPSLVRLHDHVKQLTVGRDHACALIDDGTAYCWGSNALGQIGAPTTELCFGDSSTPSPCATTPIRVAGEFHFLSLSAGVHSTCGLTVERSAVCWGYTPATRSDTLQPPPCTDSLSTDRCSRTPAVVARALWTWRVNLQAVQHPIVALKTGAFRSCATDDEHRLYCWGFSPGWDYPIGNTPILEGHGVGTIVIGYRHACALNDAGVASCWGWRDLGALGGGDSIRPPADEGYARRFADRREVVGRHRFSELAAGWLHTCGIARDTISRASRAASGTLFCWGDNSHGQLGSSPSASDTMTFALTDTSALAQRSRRHGHGTPERVDIPSNAIHVA